MDDKAVEQAMNEAAQAACEAYVAKLAELTKGESELAEALTGRSHEHDALFQEAPGGKPVYMRVKYEFSAHPAVISLAVARAKAAIDLRHAEVEVTGASSSG